VINPIKGMVNETLIKVKNRIIAVVFSVYCHVNDNRDEFTISERK